MRSGDARPSDMGVMTIGLALAALVGIILLSFAG